MDEGISQRGEYSVIVTHHVGAHRPLFGL